MKTAGQQKRQATVHELKVQLHQQEERIAELKNEVCDSFLHEQHRIGRDLHDTICAELAAAAYLGAEAAAHIDKKPESAEVSRVVRIVQEANVKIRDISHGLAAEVKAGDLEMALRDFAGRISNRHHIRCQFECHAPLLLKDDKTSTHLYLIAKQAVFNAMEHGHSRHVCLATGRFGDRQYLTIRSDGLRFKQPTREGLGLKIMEYRAAVIGGSLSIKPGARYGTLVTCTFEFRRNDRYDANRAKSITNRYTAAAD